VTPITAARLGIGHRAPMLEFFLLCAWYAWTPASGSVNHYELYVDGRRYPEIAYTASHEICVYDDREHTVAVVAVDIDGNRSEISDASKPYRYPHTEYRLPVSNILRADFDGNGTVGIGDWGVFQSLFGSCHDFGEPCE